MVPDRGHGSLAGRSSDRARARRRRLADRTACHDEPPLPAAWPDIGPADAACRCAPADGARRVCSPSPGRRSPSAVPRRGRHAAARDASPSRQRWRCRWPGRRTTRRGWRCSRTVTASAATCTTWSSSGCSRSACPGERCSARRTRPGGRATRRARPSTTSTPRSTTSGARSSSSAPPRRARRPADASRQPRRASARGSSASGPTCGCEGPVDTAVARAGAGRTCWRSCARPCPTSARHAQATSVDVILTCQRRRRRSSVTRQRPGLRRRRWSAVGLRNMRRASGSARWRRAIIDSQSRGRHHSGRGRCRLGDPTSGIRRLIRDLVPSSGLLLTGRRQALDVAWYRD